MYRNIAIHLTAHRKEMAAVTTKSGL